MGGGQNVALNFLHGLFEINNPTHKYFFLVVRNSPLHLFLKEKKCQNVLLTSKSPILRVFKEFLYFPSIIKDLKVNIIYTYFGYALFRGNTPQVCGVAISNVFFPEIKFWQGNFIRVTARKLIDIYRIYGLKKATALIFENKKMEERCNSLFQISKDRTIFIPPSFSLSTYQEDLILPELNVKSLKLLMLCGWQLHKNIMMVPEIAFQLKKRNLKIQFIITAPKDNSKLHEDFQTIVNNYDVQDMISLIGPIKKQQLKSLYEQIDCVLLMSKLESFSNNIIESWYFNKPLIVSNEEWAHSICKNAAYYINRNSAKDISNSIRELVSSPLIQIELIEEGKNQLENYPSITEKTRKEIAFLEKIYNDYKTTY